MIEAAACSAFRTSRRTVPAPLAPDLPFDRPGLYEVRYTGYEVAVR